MTTTKPTCELAGYAYDVNCDDCMARKFINLRSPDKEYSKARQTELLVSLPLDQAKRVIKIVRERSA